MSNIPQIVSVLSSILQNGRVHSNKEYYASCPFCHHHKPKLAINLSTGKWQCWKCSSRGKNIWSLVKKLDVPSYIKSELRDILRSETFGAGLDDPDTEPPPVLQLPEEFIPLWIPNKSYSYKLARNYLTSRKVFLQHIKKYKMGYCESGLYRNRVLVPNYDSTGRLNYFTGRDFTDSSSMKYLNSYVSKNIIGFENLINWNEPPVLVEGAFDAIAVGINSIPLYGKTIPRKLMSAILYEHKIPQVIMMLDADAVRDAAKQAQKLMNNGVDVLWVDMDKKDPAEMTKLEIFTKLKSATKMSFIDLVKAKL